MPLHRAHKGNNQGQHSKPNNLNSLLLDVRLVERNPKLVEFWEEKRRERTNMCAFWLKKQAKRNTHAVCQTST